MGKLSGAERLREAARVLRERAEAAAPGPWIAENYETYAGAPLWGVRTEVRSYVSDVAEVIATEGDAAFIATMHPGVALAVADWLDHEARVREESDLRHHYFPFARAKQSDAVADAILGGA